VAHCLGCFEGYQKGFIQRLNQAMKDRWQDRMVEDALGMPTQNLCTSSYNSSSNYQLSNFTILVKQGFYFNLSWHISPMLLHIKVWMIGLDNMDWVHPSYGSKWALIMNVRTVGHRKIRCIIRLFEFINMLSLFS
jgi:hypothetical protein